jgi:hypothetical protein
MDQMDEPNPKPLAKRADGDTTPEQPAQTDAFVAALARGSGHISDAAVPHAIERTEHSVMEGLPEHKVERIASIYRELAELQRQLIAAQQRIATEIQGRAEDADRYEELEGHLQAQELKSKQDAARATELETELATLRTQLATAATTADELRRDLTARDAQMEESRRQHAEATHQLEVQARAMQEAKVLLDSRDAELATRTSERDAAKARLDEDLKQHSEALAARDKDVVAMTADRDAVKAELETARRDLEAARAKARDIASHLLRFGQELDGNAVAATERPQRAQPPPMPPARPAPVETILEVREEPRPAASGVRSVLLILGGVVLGCAVSIAIAKAGNSTPPTEDRSPTPASAALATEPAPDPVAPIEKMAEPTAAAPAETPAVTPVTEEPKDNSAPPATEGVIVLPEAASGHRVFVDGKSVDIKSSRAVVQCGTREIRIGSRGTPRTIDVACGRETAIPADPRDR